MFLGGDIIKALKKTFGEENDLFCNLCGFPMKLNRETDEYECTHCFQKMILDPDDGAYMYEYDEEEVDEYYPDGPVDDSHIYSFDD